MENKNFKLFNAILNIILGIIIYISLFTVIMKMLATKEPMVFTVIFIFIPFIFTGFGMFVEGLINLYLIHIYPNTNYRLEKVITFISQKYYNICKWSYFFIFIATFIYAYFKYLKYM